VLNINYQISLSNIYCQMSLPDVIDIYHYLSSL
jgi:hypothetical protein